MRAAPAVRSAATFAWRNVLLAIVVVLTAMVGLALLTEAMSDGGGTVYLANFSSDAQIGPSGPSIVVTGTGRAAAPAEQASMQLTLGSTDQYYPGINTQPTPSATPGAEEHGRVEPVVRAIVEQGVEREAIRVIVSPAIMANCYAPAEACFSARIDLTVEEPTIERLNAIVAAARQAIPEVGLRIESVGASYHVADCAVLRQRAREQATEDARKRAEQQAAVLGVTLGDLLLSSDVPPVASTATGCGEPQQTAANLTYSGPADGSTLPPFDPGAPAEAVAIVQVNFAFAIPTTDEEA